jgi:membrane fusion protein, multidrug efflux system
VAPRRDSQESELARFVMRGLRRFLTILFVGILAGGVVWAIIGKGAPPHSSAQLESDGPVPVLAAAASVADVPVYLDGVGTVRALNMVTVHTLVDGTLTAVNFREGQDVKAGEVLARIDPRTYQAQLDQAVAKKALDEAQLANARLDLDRYTNLIKTNAATRQQLDTQRAMVAQLEAQVKLDQGAIDNAKTYLDYCTIVSPLNGRTGLRLVDQGNIVHAADATGIVVLTQIQPIAVLFTLPQQLLPRVNKAFGKGPLAVEAIASDSKIALDRGTLTVINNQVDPATGTVQLKAEFPNLDLQLWPGQFVNIRLLIDTLQRVVTVSSAAIQRGPNGPFVYALQANDTVTVRPVTVVEQDENRAVVAGIAASEDVVTTGFGQLANGRKVRAAREAPDQGSRAAAASKADNRGGSPNDDVAGAPTRTRASPTQ